MEDTDFEVEVEGTEVLPDMVGDATIVEEEEDFCAEDAGKGEGDVAERDFRGSLVDVPVEDVGKEGDSGFLFITPPSEP